jgi:uncharacterized membrane protein YjgN (DUF898 family)
MEQAALASVQVTRVGFTGRAGAYFRIWIVSLCLSLLTLGVYSAWGKVRKRRYLYAHTRIDGDGFDYRAPPLRILKGRLMALTLFGGLALAAHFIAWMQLVLFVVFIALLPWLVVASARFNARYTTYRGIAFGFTGRIGEATRVFLGLGLLVPLTLGLLYPYYRRRRASFVVAHHRYGATQFGADITTSAFTLVYLMAGLMLLGTMVLSFVLAGVAMLIGRAAGEDSGVAALVPIVAIYAAYLMIFAYVRAGTANATFNGTTIGPLRLHSTLGGWRLGWLYLTNALAIVGSLGLATAWATVRMARYRAECLSVLGAAPIATLPGGAQGDANATGSEVSDLFDVDVAL